MDRAQTPVDGATILVIIIGLVVAALVFGTVAGQVTSPEAQAYMDRAESWCGDHGGYTYVSNALGKHAGLHCDMGHRAVHMHDVAESGWPADAGEVPDPEYGPLYITETVALAVGITVVVGGIVLYRRRTRTE